MALDAVEKGFAELLGYLAFSSIAHDIDVDELTTDLVELLGRYIDLKKNA